MEAANIRDFSQKIRDKKDLYEASYRNGWFLPSLKSTMVTERYILNVIDGSTYCLKLEEVRLKACPRPPSKEIL